LGARRATVQEFFAALPQAALHGESTTSITGISIDSRLVREGDLFAALVGHDLDGHAFIEDAADKGASALLVERVVASRLPQIAVPDTRAALAAVSARFYGDPSREVGIIGITGTDGKTTTSYLIDHILRSAALRTGLVGTVTIRVGDREDHHPSRQTTPESSEIQRLLRAMVDIGTDWGILEATSHGLAMHRLDHVRFGIGAVTNITHEHLDFHGTIESYRRAKALLVERVGESGGVVIFNADDEGARSVAPFARGARLLSFSARGGDADLRALDIDANPEGSRFTLEAGEHGRVSIHLPYIGDFNVSNSLCAAGVALAAGLDLEAIGRALHTAPPVPGRMARVDAGQPFGVVVDYAHTPDSLAKVLVLLRGLHASGKLIAVFGSAGERDIEKRPLQGAVAARLADITVVTSEDPRQENADAIIAEIAAGAEAAGAIAGQTLHRQSDRREAIRLALQLARPGDCVLLAGKGHEASIIWGREKVPWDEASVARELLSEAGYPGSGEARSL
jgi:UDP-N-acetylmuramoyl-L-alanyl-D-glutamate--2,6-diaminopimelate ligase